MTLSRRTFLVGGSSAVALGALGRPGAAAAASGAGLSTFDYTGVRLLESRWQAQQADVLNYYLAVPNDDYLIGFRHRAGQTPPGNELGGWYSDDLFNPFGQIVSGLARFWVATGSRDAYEKVHALVDGFVSCIEPDGYFFYSDQPKALHYGYDKILCGLLDAWLYCGSDAALQAMQRVTDWADNPEHLKLKQDDYAYSDDIEWTEWYTLSENLYRAFLATGDQRYRDFGAIWEYRDFWDRFYRDEDWFQTPGGAAQPDYHAYSHVNSLSGLGAGYRLDGDEYYLAAMRTAYQRLRESQVFATGGYGPYERIKKDRQRLAADLARGPWSFETQCGSWAAFKLSKYLLTATGDARHGDWAEEMLYNGVGASIPMDADGKVMYHSDCSSRGGVKRNINPWSCCSGTRPQAIADYTDLVFLHSPDRLCINLFLPASVRWPTDSGELTAHIETRFPADSRVSLVIDTAPARDLDIAFRRPGWLAATPTLRVNGAQVRPIPDELHWIVARRTWAAGDRVTVELPAALHSRRFLPDTAFPTAVNHGPIALAFRTTENPVSGGTDADLIESLAPDGPLRWSLADRPDVTVVPFYELPKEDRYYLYVDPHARPYIDLPFGWGCNEILFFTNVIDLPATCEFNGVGVRYHWKTWDDAGYADITVDGELVQTINQYGPVPGVDAVTEITNLAPGAHRIAVTCTGRRDPASSDIFVNIAEFEAITP